MKKNMIYPFILLGVCLLLASSCKPENIDGQNTSTQIANVQIPAGTFTMGSPATEVNRGLDETQYQVTLSTFRISKYEITNAQFAVFLNAKKVGISGINTVGAFPNQPLIYESSGLYDWGLHYNGEQWIPVEGFENHPVINVTWYGATEFASYSEGRLPTEAEWEYACRASTFAPFNTGDCLSDRQVNYNWAYPYGACSNTNTKYPGKTLSIGSYAPNAYGLSDMHGNVWEWCSDWYGSYPATPQTNPLGPGSGSYRVIRGGSWNYDANHCRSAFRGISDPSRYLNGVGFRVVLIP